MLDMALNNKHEHITFIIGLGRLCALIGKRVISIGKTFQKLPFPFSPLFYVLHLLRAALRLYNFIFYTKNKNLGETRKFLFSAFKVIIAILALVLCFFMSVPAALGSAFLLYSVVKLLDSSFVLVFSFFAHFKLDKTLPENKWRRDQYWDNIIKHINILALGVAMTLLTAIVLAGGVVNIVWISPIIILSLAIASVVTVVSFFYLCSLGYQHYKFRNDSVLQAETDANLKKFAGLFVVWLLALAFAAIPFFVPAIPALAFVASLLTLGTVVSFFYLARACYQRYRFREDPNLTKEMDADIKKFTAIFFIFLLSLLLIAVASCIPVLSPLVPVIGLLNFCNVYDSIKSFYDNFDKTKVADPEPTGVDPKNALQDSSTWCYYGENFIPYLKAIPCDIENSVAAIQDPKDNKENGSYLKKVSLENSKLISDIIKGNHIFVIKKILVYVKELEAKMEQSSLETEKREAKRRYLLLKLAQTLKDEGENDSDYLISILVKTCKALDQDIDVLAGKPLNSKTMNNISNINSLKAEIDEVIEYRKSQHANGKKKYYTKENSSLLNLLLVYENSDLDKEIEELEMGKKWYYYLDQSFFRNTSECNLLRKLLECCRKIQKQAKKLQAEQPQDTVDLPANSVANGYMNGHVLGI
jgi:ABC-type proline/glycine betaine transport system permease subunit